MAQYLIQGETLTAVADKIREYVGGGYEIDSSVIEADGFLIYGSVTVAYRETIDDTNGSQVGDGNYSPNDVFIAYGYLENNSGETVPVIYKTDIYGDEPDYPDYNDIFYYEGKSDIDGVTYDKWRKIDSDYPWESSSQIYIYTNEIVSSGTSTPINPVDFPEKIDEVYNAGVSSGGIVLPTLTNEGTSADLLSGKQLIDSEGNIVEGTIATKTSSNITVSGTTVTVPAGYYASTATKTVTPTYTYVTWNIPSGWTATAGTGTYYVGGTLTLSSGTSYIFNRIYIGYLSNKITIDNGIVIYTGSTYVPLTNTNSLVIKITGGTDKATTSFISWLYSNFG